MDEDIATGGVELDIGVAQVSLVGVPVDGRAHAAEVDEGDVVVVDLIAVDVHRDEPAGREVDPVEIGGWIHWLPGHDGEGDEVVAVVTAEADDVAPGVEAG